MGFLKMLLFVIIMIVPMTILILSVYERYLEALLVAVLSEILIIVFVNFIENTTCRKYIKAQYPDAVFKPKVGYITKLDSVSKLIFYVPIKGSTDTIKYNHNRENKDED